MTNDLRRKTDAPEIALRRLGAGSSASTAFVTEWAMEQTAGTAGEPQAEPVFVVVGFDGSESGQRALDAAADLLSAREGVLEIVYVDHVSAGSAPTKPLSASSRASADDPEPRLASQIRARLQPKERRWHFQRRVGAVAEQLIGVADELRHQHGSDATIVLVVGGPSRTRDHVDGSVALNLALADEFPLVVVP